MMPWQRFLFPLFILMILYSLPMEATAMGTLRIASTSFKHNDHIPSKYTCDGADVNPPLAISGIPPKTQSLALIVDDPDAPRGTWVHWVLWNIPADVKDIKEDSVPAGASQGMNDFRKVTYGGPCPPSGTHRYFFKLYALETELTLGPDTTKAGLEAAMEGHILDKVEMIGLYQRK